MHERDVFVVEDAEITFLPNSTVPPISIRLAKNAMPVIVPAVFTALLLLSIAAPPEVKPPALRAGDELVWRGVCVEESVRLDQPFKRSSKVEVRAFVLNLNEGTCDAAMMTMLTPQEDEKIAQAAVAVAGAARVAQAPPAVKLELIRIPMKGPIEVLISVGNPPPIVLTAKTKSMPAPQCPRDGPNPAECGVFPPRPLGELKPPVMLAGAEVTELTVTTRETTGCTVAERLWLSPADGLCRVLWRRIDNPAQGLRIETRLDLEPVEAHRGAARDALKREIEFASWFDALATDGTIDKVNVASRIERFCADYTATSFRPAVVAALRRAKRQ